MINLNANVGIDAGNHTSKLAYNNKFIASIPKFNLIELREQAEIFFDEPVFSCVIALPDFYSKRQRDDVIFNAKKSGFKDIQIISAHEAMINALEDKNRVLILDFGASKSEIIFFDNNEILDNEIFYDICGNEFDKIFSQWLCERFTLNLIDEKILLSRAELIKIALSSNDFITWREISIMREDFERLIRFSVKRILHTIERFIECYRPKKFIITGGCSEIPLVRKIFNALNIQIEYNTNLIASGASLKARMSSQENKSSEKINVFAKIRELRGELIEIEELLTRKQKDKIYFLFRQAEGLLTNDIINLLENLIKSIKKLGVRK